MSSAHVKPRGLDGSRYCEDTFDHDSEKRPLVSVIMPTYNEPPQFLCCAIESIIHQTYTEWELLVLDDSTREETVCAIDSYLYDSRIRVFREKQRMGFVPALNIGLEKAKGKYIARMDGDDVSLPDRFEKEIDFLERHPKISVVGGQIDIIDENGVTISHRPYPNKGILLELYSCIRCPLAHPTVMMRRELIDAGYRYNVKLKMSEDLDLWLRILNDKYKIENLDNTLLRYRVESNFTAKRTATEQRQCMARVRGNNFDKRRLFYSSLSCAIGWLFTHAPVEVLKSFYNMENRQKKSHTEKENRMQ